MATSNNNRKVVPEAMDALDKFKYEVASDIAVKNISDILSTSYFFIYAIFLLIFFISFSSLNLK